MLALYSTKAYARDTELDELIGKSAPFLVPISFYLNDVKYFRQGEDDEKKACGTIVTLHDDTELHIEDSYRRFLESVEAFVKSM